MSSAPVTARRWRAFANAVALTLGVNVWLSLVVLPGGNVGALHGPLRLFAAALPLLVLLAGLARRSELILLGVFPSALLVPVALTPQMAAPHVYGPVRFAMVAVGVVAYLLGVSFFTTFHEPPEPVSVRPLSSAQGPMPARWRRRERIYWGMVGLSLVFPAVLLWFANYDDQVQAFLAEMYPGRAPLMTTVLDVCVLALWLFVYLHVFLGVLRPHRTGDRDLVTTIGILRAEARRGRPRPRFYLGVVIALASMAMLLVLRHL